jgi:hypothetical protein
VAFFFSRGRAGVEKETTPEQPTDERASERMLLPYAYDETTGVAEFRAWSPYESLRLNHFQDVQAALVPSTHEDAAAAEAVDAAALPPHDDEEPLYVLLKAQQFRARARGTKTDVLLRVAPPPFTRRLFRTLLRLAADWEIECTEGMPRVRLVVDERTCEEINMLVCMTRPCSAAEKVDWDGVEHLLDLVASQVDP